MYMCGNSLHETEMIPLETRELTAKCLKGGAGDMVEAHSSKDVETEGVQVILFFLFPWLHHWRGEKQQSLGNREPKIHNFASNQN